MGILRTAFAVRVGLTYSGLYNIETGHKGSRIETLHRIAKALDLPIGAVVIENRGDSPGPEPRHPGDNPIRYPKRGHEEPDADEPADAESRRSA